MDREWGSKPGSGGAASAQNEAIDRRERLRRLALETIDLAKDPYFMRNHLGSYECKLCLTLHNNEGNYLAHTQGKRHQTNLAKRAAREAKDAPAQPQPNKRKLAPRKSVKIGRPGYRVTKQYDPDTKQHSFLFEIGYPEIEENSKPRHRFMSSYEQKVESWDRRYQYLLFAAEPYETIAFKIPSTEIDKSTNKFFNFWDPDKKEYIVSFFYELCSCTSSQDCRKLINLHQPLGLCRMGLELLALRHDHRDKFHHPRHKFRHRLLRHLLLLLLECHLGCLRPLRHILEMALHVQ
ncbi:hypothetical protein PR202_ga26293 [Eleusine coracana subsp. coracana]|uniref:Matrin-type domain-containing protein n=1 Tax=Eleusine coracana subsp. coracana TaxID=191504 RepID=A0AAV5DE34_ELECO|nr:hypothetical protein PR202_ga26293 [Eleusine coracana subsp. coracana]